MNTHRIAELLRELADAFDSKEESEDKPRPRVRVHPAPLQKPSEMDVARARKMLRRRGIHT